MIDAVKAVPPPGMIHVANDGRALTEQEAVQHYAEFYRGHISADEIIALAHPTYPHLFAIFVPSQYSDICARAEAQVKELIRLMFDATSPERKR